MYKFRTIFEEIVSRSLTSHEQIWTSCEQVMKKERAIHEQDMNKSWTSCEQAMKYSCKGYEQVINKSWTNFETFLCKSWTSHG